MFCSSVDASRHRSYINYGYGYSETTNSPNKPSFGNLAPLDASDYGRSYESGDVRNLNYGYSVTSNNNHGSNSFTYGKPSYIGGTDQNYHLIKNDGTYRQGEQVAGLPPYSMYRAQNRFHPTTFNADANEHTGEVVLSADNTNSQDNFLQDNSAVSSDLVSDLTAQGSDSGGSQVDLQPPVNSAYEYTAPVLPSGYDYHPPPPVTPYYYPPPPPAPPSIQYLPAPIRPPPPPPLPTKSTHYYLGAKLWFLPLLFSAYYIIYVALLIFRALARHKYNFSQNLFSAATSLSSARSDGSLLDQLTRSVTRQLVNASVKYLERSKD